MNTNEDRAQSIARFKDGAALLEQAIIGLGDAELDTKPSAGGWTSLEKTE